MKEKVAMIQLTLLGDMNGTELSISTLIMKDGANRCNMGIENVRRSGDGGRERSHSSPGPRREGV